MKALDALIDAAGEDPLVLVSLVAWLGLVAALFFGAPAYGATMPVGAASLGREVKQMNRATLVLALCAGCAATDPGGGQSLLPGSRGPVPVPLVDALPDDAPPLAADVSPALAPDMAADLAPPAPDAAEFPSCAAVGFLEPKNGYTTCEPGRRTADQRYTCALCGAVPPRACVSASTAGDRRSICVSRCEDCPVILDCDHGCVQIGLDGGS